MNRTDEINRIFSNVGKIRDKVDYMLNIIENNQKIDRDNLFVKVSSNIGTTLNDKIVEISDFFKMHGVDFYDESVLRYIIENDLMNIVNNALNVISKYLLELNIYSENRLKNSNFFGIRSKKQKLNDKNKIMAMNNILGEYENLNSRVLNYNFEDNIISNIVEFIDRRGYDWYKNNIGTIESIEDELDNLELNNLVFKLEKLVKEKDYVDILPNSDFDIKRKHSNKKGLHKDDIIILGKEKLSNDKKLEQLKNIRDRLNSSYDEQPSKKNVQI